LVLLVLVLVGSAIRRLWLYERTFGWTVTRLHAGVFELWLGVTLVVVGAAWLLRRSDRAPRLVIGSAALTLLLLGWSGPDAVVASGNVDRYLSTGTLDTDYVTRLSADAVPALSRLPEPMRTCVLYGFTVRPAPWYATNLGRVRAAAVLTTLRPIPPDANSCLTGDR
jgi:hypothetical protein